MRGWLKHFPRRPTSRQPSPLPPSPQLYYAAPSPPPPPPPPPAAAPPTASLVGVGGGAYPGATAAPHPATQGNHSKIFFHLGNFEWEGAPAEAYKVGCREAYMVGCRDIRAAADCFCVGFIMRVSRALLLNGDYSVGQRYCLGSYAVRGAALRRYVPLSGTVSERGALPQGGGRADRKEEEVALADFSPRE